MRCHRNGRSCERRIRRETKRSAAETTGAERFDGLGYYGDVTTMGLLWGDVINDMTSWLGGFNKKAVKMTTVSSDFRIAVRSDQWSFSVLKNINLILTFTNTDYKLYYIYQ